MFGAHRYTPGSALWPGMNRPAFDSGLRAELEKCLGSMIAAGEHPGAYFRPALASRISSLQQLLAAYPAPISRASWMAGEAAWLAAEIFVQARADGLNPNLPREIRWAAVCVSEYAAGLRTRLGHGNGPMDLAHAADRRPPPEAQTHDELLPVLERAIVNGFDFDETLSDRQNYELALWFLHRA